MMHAAEPADGPALVAAVRRRTGRPGLRRRPARRRGRRCRLPSSHRPAAGVTAEERAQLDDLASLFGIMSAVALFMAVFVVGSTFGFVVATRRRQLGLLRLVGATPRQVRLHGARRVRGGRCPRGRGRLPAGARWPRRCSWRCCAWRGITASTSAAEPWLAWAVAAPTGIAVALLGSWRASKRAARVSPVAALQEAGVERRRPSVWQLLVGTLCLGGAAPRWSWPTELNPVFALVTAILLPEVVVIGLYCFGGWSSRPSPALLAGRSRGATWRPGWPATTSAPRYDPGRARGADPGHLRHRRLDDRGAQLHRRLGDRAGPRAAGHAVRRQHRGRRPASADRRPSCRSSTCGSRGDDRVSVPEQRPWRRSTSTTRRASGGARPRGGRGGPPGLAGGGVAVTESWHFDQGTDVGDG